MADQIMDRKLKEKGFTIVNKPYSGSVKYKCPNGHVINYFCNGDALDCPVCCGFSPSIAGNLNNLNDRR
jgi:hypothetical protein